MMGHFMREAPSQHTGSDKGRVEIAGESRGGFLGGPGQCPDHQTGTDRQGLKTLAHQMAQAPLDPVTHNSRAHGLADHEPNGGMAGSTLHTWNYVGNECGAGRALAGADCLSKILAVSHANIAREHDSGGKLRAALLAARCEDRAAGAGTHAEAEAVLLGATTVVRLESALGHEEILFWK